MGGIVLSTPRGRCSNGRLYRCQHLGAFLGWDQAAMMPSKGNDARGAALAELEILLHHTLTDATLAPLLEEAQAESLDAEVLTLSREEAHTLSQTQGVSPYDALMAKFEPGTRSADIDTIFGDAT